MVCVPMTDPSSEGKRRSEPPGTTLDERNESDGDPSRRRPSALAPFEWPDFRRFFAATACLTLAGRGLAVVLGFQVYALTGSTLALGGLGLVEEQLAFLWLLFRTGIFGATGWSICG